MTRDPAQVPDHAEGRHLILFDGLCGFCSASVQFVLTRDRRRVFRFAPLQSPVGRAMVEKAGGDPSQLSTFLVVEDFESPPQRSLARSRAAFFVAAELGWPWRAATWLRVLPESWRDRAYDFVARHRNRLAGRRERCFVPDPEHRRRFLDEAAR